MKALIEAIESQDLKRIKLLLKDPKIIALLRKPMLLQKICRILVKSGTAKGAKIYTALLQVPGVSSIIEKSCWATTFLEMALKHAHPDLIQLLVDSKTIEQHSPEIILNLLVATNTAPRPECHDALSIVRSMALSIQERALAEEALKKRAVIERKIATLPPEKKWIWACNEAKRMNFDLAIEILGSITPAQRSFRPHNMMDMSIFVKQQLPHLDRESRLKLLRFYTLLDIEDVAYRAVQEQRIDDAVDALGIVSQEERQRWQQQHKSDLTPLLRQQLPQSDLATELTLQRLYDVLDLPMPYDFREWFAPGRYLHTMLHSMKHALQCMPPELFPIIQGYVGYFSLAECGIAWPPRQAHSQLHSRIPAHKARFLSLLPQRSMNLPTQAGWVRPLPDCGRIAAEIQAHVRELQQIPYDSGDHENYDDVILQYGSLKDIDTILAVHTLGNHGEAIVLPMLLAAIRFGRLDVFQKCVAHYRASNYFARHACGSPCYGEGAQKYQATILAALSFNQPDMMRFLFNDRNAVEWIQIHGSAIKPSVFDHPDFSVIAGFVCCGVTPDSHDLARQTLSRLYQFQELHAALAPHRKGVPEFLAWGETVDTAIRAYYDRHPTEFCADLSTRSRFPLDVFKIVLAYFFEANTLQALLAEFQALCQHEQSKATTQRQPDSVEPVVSEAQRQDATSKPASSEEKHSAEIVPPLQASSTDRVPFASQQTHVVFGQPCCAYNDPDYYAIQVGNYILGDGVLVARLFKEIRETRGLAYSAGSRFVYLKKPGPFLMYLQTKESQAADATDVMRSTLQTFIEQGPTDEEMAAAKRGIIGGFPITIGNNSQILDVISQMTFYNLPQDFLDTFCERIDQVTKQDVMRAFQKHLSPDKMVLVTVGGQ